VQRCQEEPFVVGNCKAAIPRWSFNPKTKKCEEFSYGGCGGTQNNFETLSECETSCPATTTPECLCTEDTGLVCNPTKGITFGNECEAVTCSGENPADLVPGACPDPPVQVRQNTFRALRGVEGAFNYLYRALSSSPPPPVARFFIFKIAFNEHQHVGKDVSGCDFEFARQFYQASCNISS
jgi:hypothetical protein